MCGTELDLKKFIAEYVADFVAVNEVKQETEYRLPVVGFASAGDPLFERLREVVGPSHYLPRDLLEDASTVISIFLPFAERVIKSNYGRETTSREWAVAYAETNLLLDRLSFDLADALKGLGYSALGIATTHHLAHAGKDKYSVEELTSNWSQRHVGYICGVGKFGVNNLLITVRGCAGRMGSLLTSAKIAPTPRDGGEEYCLVKRGVACSKCIERCPVNALAVGAVFNRVGCMDYLVGQRKYQERVYGLKEGTQTCGKCSTNIPCENRIPE